MATKNRHLQHIRSSVAGNAPGADQILHGELAVNFASGSETIYLKNSDNEIVGMELRSDLQPISDALAAHMARNDNPHGVTKAQVGLGNVNNTSDLNKPVSTAQQTALDKKVDKAKIADNLTTNDSTYALSAKQGIELSKKIDTVSSGSAVDLSGLISRVSSLEEEVDGTADEVDNIIAKVETMTSTEFGSK